ncbi:MAG: beta-lactamase family protein [Planctomycetota bacterium]|nr:MAG: beta-lactamase family protein [Planctomycetota bacterium]
MRGEREMMMRRKWSGSAVFWGVLAVAALVVTGGVCAPAAGQVAAVDGAADLAVGVASDGAGRYVASGWEDAAAEASALVESMREEHGVPGLSVSVVVDGQIVFSGGFGLADLEQGVAASRRTLYRLASVSKVVTASAAARLAADGRLDLDADVREYVPLFPEKPFVVTVRQLCGHLGGVRHYQLQDRLQSTPGGSIDTREYVSDNDILAIFAGDPLLARPGAAFSYSTFGFTLVGLAIEGATGKGLMEVVGEEVIEPLGLERLRRDRPREIVAHRTRFYDKGRNGTVTNSGYLNPAYKVAGGGMIATADDMARFGAAHCAPGYLGEAVFGEVFTSQTTLDGDATGTGIGWRIGRVDGRRVFQHSGAAGDAGAAAGVARGWGERVRALEPGRGRVAGGVVCASGGG